MSTASSRPGTARWLPQKDGSTGDTYWLDSDTGATTWDDPAKAPPTAGTPSGATEGGVGWVPCQDDQGNTYYFNQSTGESSWENPEKVSLAL
jgi:hypothetical protein